MSSNGLPLSNGIRKSMETKLSILGRSLFFVKVNEGRYDSKKLGIYCYADVYSKASLIYISHKGKVVICDSLDEGFRMIFEGSPETYGWHEHRNFLVWTVFEHEWNALMAQGPFSTLKTPTNKKIAVRETNACAKE